MATRAHERTAGSVPRSVEPCRAGEAKVGDATTPLTTGIGSKVGFLFPDSLAKPVVLEGTLLVRAARS